MAGVGTMPGSATQPSMGVAIKVEAQGGVVNMEGVTTTGGSRTDRIERDRPANRSRSMSRGSGSRSPSRGRKGRSSKSRSRSPAVKDDSEGNTTIYVGNLDYDSTAKEIYKEFSEFGPILYTAIPLFPTETSKGYGFVQYASPASAEKAVKQMHQSRLHGRCITVRWATRGAHRGRVDEYKPGVDGELKHERDRIVRVSGDLSPEPRRYGGYPARPQFRSSYHRSRTFSRSRSRSWSRSRSRSHSRSWSRHHRHSSSRSRSSRSRSTSRSRSRSPQLPKQIQQLPVIGVQVTVTGANTATTTTTTAPPMPQQPIAQVPPSVPAPISTTTAAPVPMPSNPPQPSGTSGSSRHSSHHRHHHSSRDRPHRHSPRRG
ncbi:hypothetical protein Pelo_711 [Pelomyxa schiedti]|nr:hypothetical protein Pelo_711 [Pelomyxa schiedti]